MGRKRRRGQWREKRGREGRTGKGEGERKEGACTHSVFVCCSYCFLLLFLLPFVVIKCSKIGALPCPNPGLTWLYNSTKFT